MTIMEQVNARKNDRVAYKQRMTNLGKNREGSSEYKAHTKVNSQNNNRRVSLYAVE